MPLTPQMLQQMGWSLRPYGGQQLWSTGGASGMSVDPVPYADPITAEMSMRPSLTRWNPYGEARGAGRFNLGRYGSGQAGPDEADFAVELSEAPTIDGDILYLPASFNPAAAIGSGVPNEKGGMGFAEGLLFVGGGLAAGAGLSSLLGGASAAAGGAGAPAGAAEGASAGGFLMPAAPAPTIAAAAPVAGSAMPLAAVPAGFVEVGAAGAGLAGAAAGAGGGGGAASGGGAGGAAAGNTLLTGGTAMNIAAGALLAQSLLGGGLGVGGGGGGSGSGGGATPPAPSAPPTPAAPPPMPAVQAPVSPVVSLLGQSATPPGTSVRQTPRKQDAMAAQFGVGIGDGSGAKQPSGFSSGAGSTFLTGNAGVPKSMLNLGVNTLLGR